MIILIADSGSTKTTWKLIDSSEKPILTVNTSGINPNYLSEDQIHTILTDELTKELTGFSVDQIHFFGSGCSRDAAKEKLKRVFLSLFKNAQSYIETDLIGACIALSSGKKSWVCILGTGSNCCIYDQNKISYQPQSLGYILGDEGSGFDIGKKLLKAYFSNQFPKELKEKWDTKYTLSYSELVKKTYRENKPNSWIASFTVFAKENINHPFMEELIYSSFESFIKNYLSPRTDDTTLPIHFVGSIAYHFKDLLNISLKKHNLVLGTVTSSPIEYLVHYFHD